MPMEYPVNCASFTAPGFTLYTGPVGPSAVNTAGCPRSSALASASSPLPPKRVLEPRAVKKPSRSMVRAISSPSKLRLMSTAGWND